MNKHVLTALGVVAFIAGGIITREKAIESVEILEKFFDKKTTPPQNPEQ